MEKRYDSHYEKELLYKMTYDELMACDWLREEEILAYMRYKGDDFRCVASIAVSGMLCPLGIMYSSDDEKPTVCKLYRGRHDPFEKDGTDRWYQSHKLSLTPADFGGIVDHWYVMDFVSAVRDGSIKILE